MNEESASLQQLQQTAQSANKAAQQSQAELKLLQTSFQLAQGNAANSQQAFDGIQQQLNEKEQTLEAAKVRDDQLTKNLATAKQDLAKTKDAAKKAEQAASEAKTNAQRTKRKLGEKRKKK